MTLGFRRARGGGVTIDLDQDEAVILRSMAGLVLELVEPPAPKDELAEFVGIGSNGDVPEDPVLARLFPDAYSADEDAEAASDFRRYTEDSLRESKRANAEAIIAAVPEHGGRVELDRHAAQAWLKSLNDVRLALGTRLGVEEDTLRSRLENFSDDESGMAALSIYDWLTRLQETLVEAIH